MKIRNRKSIVVGDLISPLSTMYKKCRGEKINKEFEKLKQLD